MILSKSDYTLFLRHPAWAWLKKHDKGKLPPVSANLQAMFDAGYLFESYAEKLFPDGVRVGFKEYGDYLSQPARTKKTFADGAKTVFQGRFEANNMTCICDVVTKIDDTTLDLYEIKSSTETKLIHEHDLAFQMVVLEACGYTVRNITVLCVNNDYVRHGEIDVKQLVTEENVTDVVKERRDDTKDHIGNALRVLSSPTIPDISPAHCGFQSLQDWLEIYRTLTTVEPGSIYDLCRLNVGLIETLEERNVRRIAEIPEDITLGSQQQLQVRATKEHRVIIERNKIKDFVSKCTFPLYFLDYETLTSVVPLFDGQRAYQQVPFQYSLHVLETPGGELKHYGYLHNEHTDPILPLTKSLMSHIGDMGTVLVWYESFEKGKNVEMGCTNDTCFTFYEKLNRRIVDLMTPFSKGWYADKDFLGSASIKSVLPVLVLELSYDDLNIHEGSSAQRIWMKTVLEGKHEKEREYILKDLEEYCKLDTFAMVKIYEKLKNTIAR